MIRKRFTWRLMPLLLLVLVSGLGGIIVTRYLASTFERELLHSLETVTRTQLIRDSVATIEHAFELAHEGDLLQADKIFSKARDAISGLLLEESTQGFTDDNVKHDFQFLDEAFRQLDTRGHLIVEGGVSGSLDTMRDNEAYVFKVNSALDHYVKAELDHARFVSKKVESLSKTTSYSLALLIASAVLVWLLIAWRLAASFVLPIEALTKSAQALRAGNWEHVVSESSDDELGLLGKAFNHLAKHLQDYKHAMTQKVQVAQRTTQAALNAASDPVIIVDSKGRETVCNPAATELAASMETRDGLLEKLSAHLKDVLQSGVHYLPGGYEHVVTYKGKLGERYYLPRIFAIGDAITGFSGAAIFLQDVTKFRLLDDAKTNLVGTVSHELKTPLTSLRMAVYLLLENQAGVLNAKQRELLEMTRNDAERLLRTLNDLLDLTRLESGIAQLKLVSIPVESLFATCAQEMKSILGSKYQTLNIEVQDPALCVLVDPEKIKHVFLNLLSNASKYSSENSTITFYAKQADAGFTRCGVKDQGAGIASENIGKIFEKFYRLPGQTGEGVGLGLAIAREIVIEHGGTINCTSVLGEGSDFYVLLPK